MFPSPMTKVIPVIWSLSKESPTRLVFQLLIISILHYRWITWVTRARHSIVLMCFRSFFVFIITWFTLHITVKYWVWTDRFKLMLVLFVFHNSGKSSQSSSIMYAIVYTLRVTGSSLWAVYIYLRTNGMVESKCCLLAKESQ